jgi:hypothetical protein
MEGPERGIIMRVESSSSNVGYTSVAVQEPIPVKKENNLDLVKNTLTTLKNEQIEQQKKEVGFFEKLGNAISSFFTSIFGWMWGADNSSTMPNDEKLEGGDLEGITSRPKLPKPQVENFDRYLNEMNNSLKKISDADTDSIRSDLDADKTTDAESLARIISVLKEMSKNHEKDIVLENEQLKQYQNSIEKIRKEKDASEEGMTGLKSASEIAATVGIVSIGLAIGGLLLAGFFFFTGGLAAIPMGVIVANALVGLGSSFNAIAKKIIDDKLNLKQGQSVAKSAQLQELSVQRKMTMEDLLDSFRAVCTVRKMLSDALRQNNDTQQSLRY